MTLKICRIEDCSTQAKYTGLCGKHYKRQWRHGNATKTLVKPKNYWAQKIICHFCDTQAAREIEGLNVCKKHSTRYYRYGRFNNERAENGEGSINAGGYRVHSNGFKREYEHIQIAEKALGRPLPKGAVVHHINHDRADNRPENLVVCPSQAYHVLLHMNEKINRIKNLPSVLIKLS